ncbi:MAG: FumA C-terminus/TtdB family hydratase beta subunit [Candidatus Margulisbacteria bacterium]|nr:FumA C-terminus/TtdB family hydratase beta subunit [Candidatus Margulisiibacteriota bacterium]
MRAPIDDKLVAKLKVGEEVLISGKIFAARDSAHKLFGKNPPFDPKGAILFYASPTPTPPGAIIGSIGPTTATRMDPFTPDLLKLGIKIMIGKGRRSESVKAAIRKYKAVYLVVPGGVAAALSKHIKKSTVIAYPQLGPEAVLELEVANFPAIVAIDSQGNDLFEQARSAR